MDELKTKLATTSIEVMLGIWEGTYDDVIDVVSLPIFMLQHAVDAMEKVKDLGDDQEEMEEKKKKAHIRGIIGAVLFVIPFVGEVGLVAAGLTQMARIVSMVGEGVIGAFGIYEFIELDTNPLFAMFGLLMGVGGFTLAERRGRFCQDEHEEELYLGR